MDIPNSNELGTLFLKLKNLSIKMFVKSQQSADEVTNTVWFQNNTTFCVPRTTTTQSLFW